MRRDEPQYDSGTETLVKSYRYLRAAMVGMLLGLAVATVYQSVGQGFLLDSISAYYHTPAQAIFVGALIAVGMSMIALKGTNTVEDVFLNFGGMLAVVVAIVPTARNADFSQAVRACRLGPVDDVDCPTVTALADVTRANVVNNMVALLVVGALALAATLLFDRWDRHGASLGRAFAVGVGAAALVYAAALVAFLASVDWFVDHAHFIAAGGLFACIIVVVIANAVRKDDRNNVAMMVRRPNLYGWIAWAMVAVAVVGATLWLTGVITLFWLETAVIAMFVVFWAVQTGERWDAEQTVIPIASRP